MNFVLVKYFWWLNEHIFVQCALKEKPLKKARYQVIT